MKLYQGSFGRILRIACMLRRDAYNTWKRHTTLSVSSASLTRFSIPCNMPSFFFLFTGTVPISESSRAVFSFKESLEKQKQASFLACRNWNILPNSNYPTLRTTLNKCQVLILHQCLTLEAYLYSCKGKIPRDWMIVPAITQPQTAPTHCKVTCISRSNCIVDLRRLKQHTKCSSC